MNHPDAPTFENDNLTGNGNSRHPAYSAWGDFASQTDLNDFFFARPDGLMCDHPGIKPLTAKHVETIDSALQRYKSMYPNAKAGFLAFLSEGGTNTRQNANLARLEWLAWWVRWAVLNCEHPAIYNF